MGVLVTSTVFRFIFFLLSIFQTFHFLVATSVLQSHLERRLLDDSGFINIDCGLPNVSYLHPPNGQYYTSDAKYISTGKNFVVTAIYESTWGLLMTVRSFPEGLRNCYNLSPVKPNNKYLIRARFMYGNYDGLNTVPTFDIYLGVNKWLTVTLRDAGTRLIKEIIHVATSESIDVCLVNTGQGTPFISTLELRPMDNSSYPASQAFSLMLWDREDIGAYEHGDGRYSVKDDGYDRLWLKSPTWPAWSNVTSTNETVDASQENPCKVPPSVLMTAGEANNTFVDLTNQYTEDEDPKTQVYAYWYFAELELLEPNETREFNIIVPHGPVYKFGPITPKYLQLTTIASPRMSINEIGGFEFTLTKTDKSNLNPILNAVEIYTVLELPAALPTNQEDADAVTAIKDKYKVPRIWQGDPCLPVSYQWDGLNCTYNGSNAPRITSLNLSSSNLIGKLPPTLSNLTSLKYLNLSNNGFTGRIPEFLAYLPALNVIDLSGNNLTGPVPGELAEKASNKSIDLRLEGNPDVCKSYPCKVNKSKKRYHFIIPVVSCVASVSLLVIIGIIFLAFKQRKKQGLASRTIKTKNKQFNSSEIVRITDNFRKVLGKGGFGTVYYGVLEDGTQVAVKVLSNTSPAITVNQFFAEADLLTRIHHVNLVSLIGYCDEHAQMSLVYEYMSSGNLQMHLSERNEHPLSWKTRLQISIDAAQGLDYLHSGCQPPIIHRDVKPGNILLDEMGHAKISDFGLSRFFTTNSQGAAISTDPAGTRGYLDPEYCHVTILSEKSDVYGFGIVLLQLLTGQVSPVKQTDDDEEDLVHIVDWVSPLVASGEILKIVDKRLQGDLIINSAWKFLEIAMECVKPTGNQRPRMNEVVADLKLCYASVDKNASFGGDNGAYYSNSNQAFDSSLVSLPSAR